MPMSRTRKILSLGLVTASLGAASMSVASPLVSSNGRPACGNTLTKSSTKGQRAMLTDDLKKLTKLVQANHDDDRPAERDALIRSIRDGLAQLEACAAPAAAPAKPATTPRR